MATRRVDVAVIGGGVVGTATAAFLAEAGASVELVEATAIAAAASGRNSGVVQHPLDPILASLHGETVDLLRVLADRSAGRFAFPTEPAGLLYVGVDGDAVGALAAELAVTHPGLSPELVGSRDLRRLEPHIAPGVVACRLAIGYPVRPADATSAYAGAARRAGATVTIGSAAGLESDGDVVSGVRVGRDRVAAGTVVVAAGPWTPALVDPSGAWRPIEPLWGCVAEIAFDAPPRHVLEEVTIDATIEPDGGDAPPGEVLAFSLVTAGGRSVLGSTFTVDEPDDRATVPSLVLRGARFVPAIAATRVIASRRCARPVSRDGRPLVGRVPGRDGLFVAAGHGPWGISTGPASARLVADLVLGRLAVPPPELDPARFAGVPAG